MALLLGLTACAAEPVPSWQPPEAEVVPGVVLIGFGDEDPDEADVPDAVEEGTPEEDAVEPTPVEAKGLVGGRLRNDALPFAARFVYVPASPDFNAKVNALLWSAIKKTGKRYAPQVHATSAKLSDRGCVPGSAAWAASDVLTRSETGPIGGAGVAVTCEVTAAFASTLVIQMRIVTGAPDAVESDASESWVVNVDSGEAAEAGKRWSDDAAEELWLRAVELLRQDAGGLSSAEIQPPDENQLSLTQAALDAARHAPSGGTPGSLEVTISPGLMAPELSGLNGGAASDGTTQPVTLSIDADTVHEWSSAQQRALLDGAGEPFAGAGTAHVPMDCALIPCVALTYDDGPSRFTAELLDTLMSKSAPATFFMLGGAASGNPATVRRAANEGHELGSHTMRHPDLTTLSDADARAQVRDAAKIIRDISGASVKSFRPPYGAVNQRVIDAVGMPAILWSVDTNDWQRPSAEVLWERGVNWPSSGDIVLFHDTHAGSVNVAGDVIDGLRDRGFEPVTVSELFGGTLPEGRVSGR